MTSDDQPAGPTYPDLTDLSRAELEAEVTALRGTINAMRGDGTPDGLAPACEFCGWVDLDRTGWVGSRTDRGMVGIPLCGFCDISVHVEAWLNAAGGKPSAIIDQMRSANLLRDELVRHVQQLGRTVDEPPLPPPPPRE